MAFRFDLQNDVIEIQDDIEYARISTVIKNLIRVPEDSILVYPNIGFTGSSSLSASLAKVVNTGAVNVTDVPELLGWSQRNLVEVAGAIRKKMDGNRLLSLHFRAPAMDFVYERNLPIIQMLRDPVRLVISTYYWSKKVVSEGGGTFYLSLEQDISNGMTFAEYVESWLPNQSNSMCRSIVISSLDVRNYDSFRALYSSVMRMSSAELLERANAALMRHTLVCFAEHMTECLFMILTAMGIRKIPLWETIGKSGAPKPNDVPDYLIEKIRELNSADLALYETQLALFNERFGEVVSEVRKLLPPLRFEDKSELMRGRLKEALSAISVTGCSLSPKGESVVMVESLDWGAHRLEFRTDVSGEALTLCLTLFARSIDRNEIRLEFVSVQNQNKFVGVHYILGGAGEIGLQDNAGSDWQYSMSINRLDSSWYRCRLSITLDKAQHIEARVGLADHRGWFLYDGDGKSGIDLKFPELTLGAHQYIF